VSVDDPHWDCQTQQRARALTATTIAVIPYQEPAAKGDNVEFQSTISSTLPMAAIFMRNKYVGW
jgi:hypothetical protein